MIEQEQRVGAVSDDRHPVEHFWRLLDELSHSDYPTGVVAIEPAERIRGTAFFSAGAGLIRRRGDPLPPFPFGGVMFVGHNLDSEGSYRRRLAAGTDHGDPDKPSMQTWRRLYAVLQLAGLDPVHAFFTNYFVGLKAGDDPTGPFPGRHDAKFVSWCEDFLDEQIRVMQPRVIIALGRDCGSRLGYGPLDPQSATRANVSFTALTMTHPSAPAYYGRVGNHRTIDVEAAALANVVRASGVQSRSAE